MIRRAWKPVAATTVLLGGPAYYYWRRQARTDSDTFDLAVKVRDAKGHTVTETRTMPLLSKSDVDSRLRANASAEVKSRPGVVWKHTTASLNANDPIEDANSNAIIQRDPLDPGAPGDLLFFTVMDGHGGPHTSQLLSKVLINAVVLELSRLISDPSTMLPKKGIWERTMSALKLSSPSTASASDADPANFSLALQNAFSNLDQQLISAPARLIAEQMQADESLRKLNQIPDVSQHPMAQDVLMPALSGSCALMAVLDTAHQNLYVACTGDSRAVAGYWEEMEPGKGVWRAEALSEDQTGRNPIELKRIQSEHPADEANTVVQRGRILGGLEPSRAFGDARYKWPLEIQDVLRQAYNTPMRMPPSLFKTPPYVIARPVVTHRKLSFLSSLPSSQSTTSSSNSDSSSKLRFIVLATDGLWDQLSSEDVVSLVGGYLAGLKGTISKSDLATLVPTHSSSSAKTVEGKDSGLRRRIEGSWAFEDDNVSSHLIRNAFGGGDEARLRRMVSIPPPLARRYRDDVTVTVVWWEPGQEEQVKTEQVKISAKL